MSQEQAGRDANGYGIGRVRISRRVLRTVIEEAAVSVRGVTSVARDIAPVPPGLGRSLPWRGIGLATHGNDVAIDLYLIAGQGENLARVGADARDAVVRAIEESLGMRVVVVNIYFQDVA
ncbi:MAG TPA: Asp23/Gls24 family envelope stress response protein [Ktedonobacterales bacterium]